MEEIHVSVRARTKSKKGRSRRLLKDLKEGKSLPGYEELIQARGLVLRERENSIFSDAWIPLALIFLVIGFVASRNQAMIALGVGMIFVALVGRWWRGLALVGVTYEREFDRTHAFPGESISLTIHIANRKPLPLTWLEFRDKTPIAPADSAKMSVIASEISGRHSLDHTLSINGYERVKRHASFIFSKRGHYDIGPVTMASGDLFTLFTIEREHRYIDRIVIYPQVFRLDELNLPAKEMFGERRVRRSLFVDPIRTQGIRDYQPEDRFRDVHWKATARRGHLQTKVYDPASGMNVVAFLNVATMAKHWLGFNPELLERAVSVTASITSYAAEQKWGFGVFANGSVPGSDQPIRVPPGRSRGQLLKTLEALAAVTEFATGSVELLMYRESSRLPWSATLLLVTAVLTEEMAATLIGLQEAGRRVVLITLMDEPPTELSDVVPCFHIPGTTPAFQRVRVSRSTTEAALDAVPNPTEIYSE